MQTGLPPIKTTIDFLTSIYSDDTYSSEVQVHAAWLVLSAKSDFVVLRGTRRWFVILSQGNRKSYSRCLVFLRSTNFIDDEATGRIGDLTISPINGKPHAFRVETPPVGDEHAGKAIFLEKKGDTTAVSPFWTLPRRDTPESLRKAVADITVNGELHPDLQAVGLPAQNGDSPSLLPSLSR